ncbi:leucine--tRNA ligase [Fusobacterium sp. IOR10]|uniref:leucine--tRNA ligase n=1 Tax=Fusobacterium sp. IOR10 TaxID=2665157 RepID=UPI0013D4D42C|nr:leucine--tRNA ligase [Fusobacterium sp. IOR10]
MKEYNFREVEEKWQEKWNKNNLFKTENTVDNKENYYVLVMLPYPSGKLHVGHARNYTIGDVISRYKRMKGYNVLQPMGWDSFGLPAENAAIQNGVHPDLWTKSNIKNMKRQLKLMGLSYDWDREIASYTPEYYKWNQWMFKKFYEKGLIYKKKSTVNWCPDCQTVLANEQVEDGKCWRHSKTQVIQKDLEQWFFKITDYADELLEGHKELKGGWPDKVLAMQKNWIGKSYGTEIVFTVEETGEKLPMFTTRIDTIYGVTYAVVAPEHPIVGKVIAENDSLKEKIEAMKNTDIIERTAEGKEKNGIDTGWHVINPVNGEKVPLWIADYVLMNYGTGAVMAVPAHDERDFAFAKKYNLPMKVVINPKGQKEIINVNDMEEAFTDIGELVNSGKFDGTNSKKAIGLMADYVEENNWGEKTVKYRLKDWGISRQRYWGTPIPALYCEKCGTVMEKDENLPVNLPKDVKFTGNGNPIETSEEYKNAVCPICGGPARRETDTMDTFFDSSWYFLRYCDPKNEKAPFDKEIVDKWFPVNQYIGGVEHAVMHLLYARFFHKALRDINLVSSNEPFKRLLTQGMVLSNSYFSEKENKFLFLNEVETKGAKAYSIKTGEELSVKMEKMSKSKNNGVDPEEIILNYGADAVRLFIMFAAPPERELEWNENGLSGAVRFLNRVWRIVIENKDYISEEQIDYTKVSKEDKSLVRKLHQTIKRITDSIEDNYHFNTAIAGTMELVNEIYSYRANVLGTEKETSESKKIFGETIRDIIIMLSPFTPHFAEELWEELNKDKDLFNVSWPKYNEKLTISDEVTMAIQVNGKMRGSITIDSNLSKEEIEKRAFEVENVIKHTEGKNIVKVIVVPKKIVNIVVK